MHKILISFIVLLFCAAELSGPASGQVCSSAENVSLHSHQIMYSGTSTTWSIGIAFHVLHQGGSENIGLSDLQTQINVLNNAFDNSPFSFYLALVTRTNNSTWFNLPTSYQSLTSTIRDALLFDTTHLINVFIGNMPDQGDWIGNSAFPDDYPPSIHAVLIDYVALPGGPTDPHFNAGDILVHEIGHYLGLLHPFQDGCQINEALGDGVADTPAASETTTHFRTCPVMPDTCPGSSGGLAGTDPVRNYMYATTDACRVEFTPVDWSEGSLEGQIGRMITEVTDHRENFGGKIIDIPIDRTVASNSNWTFYEGEYRFASGKKLTVNGVFNVAGTSTKRVALTSSTTSNSWSGISFLGAGKPPKIGSNV